MSGSLAPTLLRIAAAVDGDGGVAVRAVLESILEDRAPFEAGEIVYARTPGAHASFLLGQAREAFLAGDLVDHVLALGAPLRIDDLRDAAPFPETLALLRRLALRSVLVLPFRFGEPGWPPGPLLRGAVALARGHGWAFAGASLPLLVPVAGLAGLAFDHSLRLSAAGPGASPASRPEPPPAPPPLADVPPVVPEPEAPPRDSGAAAEAAAEAMAARAEAATARGEAEAARSLAEGLRAELEAARQDAARVAEGLREVTEADRTHRAGLESAEEARREAERLRDDWAQQAASLRARVDEQAQEIQGLKKGMAGARESAASAADVAEARAVRVRELEAELSHALHERDLARGEADAARPAPSPEAPTPSAAEPGGPAPDAPIRPPGRKKGRRPPPVA